MQTAESLPVWRLSDQIPTDPLNIKSRQCHEEKTQNRDWDEVVGWTLLGAGVADDWNEVQSPVGNWEYGGAGWPRKREQSGRRLRMNGESTEP